MKRLLHLPFISVLFALLFGACNQQQQPESDPPKPETFSVATDTITVQPGEETVQCFFPKLDNDEPIDIQRFHVKSPIGHHFVVYTSAHDVNSPPVSCPQGGQPGYDVVLGVQHGDTDIVLPAGVGLPLKAHQQLVLELHVINATSQAQNVKGEVEFEVAEPGTVKQKAFVYFVGPTAFKGEPKTTFSASASCALPEDIHFLYMFGHQHKYGTNVKVSVSDGQGTPDVIYTSDNWENPPISKKEFSVGPTQANTTIEVGCDWDNTGDKPMTYLGEMCFATGMATLVDPKAPAKGQMVCVTAGTDPDCQCLFSSSTDVGDGGATFDVNLSIADNVVKPGDTDWGAPLFCYLYAGSPLADPTAFSYVAQEASATLKTSADSASLHFYDVTPGKYSLLCYMDSTGGGLNPNSGSPFALTDVNVTDGGSADAVMSLTIP